MSYRTICLVTILSFAADALAGPSESVIAALADVQTRPVTEHHFLYYLKLDHLPIAERQEQWQVISGALNGTSRKRRIVPPVVILYPSRQGGPMEEGDGRFIVAKDWERATLIRINIRDYGYEKEVFEKLAKVESHFHYREKDQQVTIVKAVPGIVPAVVEDNSPPFSLGGVQYFKDGDRGSLVEVKEADIKGGDDIYIRFRQGGALEKFRVPMRKQEKQKPQVIKQEEKKAEDKILHGAWLPAKEIASLALATNSESPIQLADWFWWQIVIQTDREPGPGYYDLLGIKNQDDFHRRTGFDPKLFKEKFEEFVAEYRAAQKSSGVARQPRRISVEDKLGGEIWVTFDNKKATGRSNPLDTPDDDFKFNATEQFAHLSNGFLAQGLFVGNAPLEKNQKLGDIQDSAPDFIGPDKTATGNDGRIHAGICWRCHDQGMKPVDDYYQKTFRHPIKIGGPDDKKIYDLQEKYFGRLQEKLKLTNDRHAAAVKEATGLTLQAYSKAIGNRWLKFEDTEVDVARASRELGVTSQRLIGALKLYKQEGKLNGITVLDSWIASDKNTIPLLQWLEVITEAHKAIAASGLKP